MNIRYFELRAANKDCQEKFSEVAKQVYKKKPIFEYACNYVNESASYKRNGRKLEIIAIEDFCITIKLTSESKLEMASKSLAGFTRELIRIDKDLNQEEQNRLFGCFITNNTLFRNNQIEAKDYTIEMQASTKKAIKKFLSEYDSFSRLNCMSRAR